MVMDKKRYTFEATSEYDSIEIEELEHDVCSGSFCSVSKARIIPSGQTVAVKRTREAVAETPRFSRGCPAYTPRTLYRVNGTPVCIVEEWVEGKSLYDLANGGPIDYAVLEEVCLQLLAIAWDLVYRQRIYHADLTPSNVLLERQRGKIELKVIDFDPWYPIDCAGYVTSENVSGSMPFMPPEHLFGALRFDADKAASYCVGSILHYLAYGYPPYCYGLDRPHVERLLFGPRGLPPESRARRQLEDCREFRSIVSAGADQHDEAEADTVHGLMKNLLNPNPQSRMGLESAIRTLGRRTKSWSKI